MESSPITIDSNGYENEGCEYRERIGISGEGQTLLDYLSRRYHHSSRSDWNDRITSGRVILDSRPAHPESILHRRSEIVWQRPPWIEPYAPRSFSVLYEDADMIAVNKPAGLPTLPGANFLQSTLLYLVRTCIPDAVPLHRLGRWTSGVVLCARNRRARTDLMQQWSAREVGKRYRALASGLPDFDNKTISVPIGPIPHPFLGSLHAADPNGKPSFSRVTVLERDEEAFLCDVHITTGRPHQIRIHLAAIGHPLLGDPLYGSGGLPKPHSRALPGDPGYSLHAAELSFRHPSTGRTVSIECEPPMHLRPSN
jgi:23S rRNA pseudouridine1911/1915/1917 synthase